MKNTNVTAVKALMNANKNISVKGICEKTGLSKSQVYAIRHYIKANPKKKLTPVNKKKTVKTNTNKLIKSPYITSLETQVHELEKLHDGWRQNYKKLEADYTQAKIMYLDSQAVVRYLETKIEQLLK